MASGLEKEVQEIFEAIEDYSTGESLWSTVAESTAEKLFIIIAVTSIMATIILSFLPEFKSYFLASGLIFLINSIIYTVFGAFTIFNDFKKPLNGYSKRSKERIKLRLAFIQKLATYSPDALQFAEKTVDNDFNRIQERLYMLVGEIRKVGFIPAGLALFFATSQTASDQVGLSANLLMAFIFGIYLGAFIVHRMIELLSLNKKCLHEAKSIADLRHSIKNAKQL